MHLNVPHTGASVVQRHGQSQRRSVGGRVAAASQPVEMSPGFVLAATLINPTSTDPDQPSLPRPSRARLRLKQSQSSRTTTHRCAAPRPTGNKVDEASSSKDLSRCKRNFDATSKAKCVRLCRAPGGKTAYCKLDSSQSETTLPRLRSTQLSSVQSMGKSEHDGGSRLFSNCECERDFLEKPPAEFELFFTATEFKTL